jgi:hypothetical protein
MRFQLSPDLATDGSQLCTRSPIACVRPVRSRSSASRPSRLGATGERTDLTRGPRPRSYQVTLDGLARRRRHNAGRSDLTGRHSESSQPPPTESLQAIGRRHSGDIDSECANVTWRAVPTERSERRAPAARRRHRPITLRVAPSARGCQTLLGDIRECHPTSADSTASEPRDHSPASHSMGVEMVRNLGPWPGGMDSRRRLDTQRRSEEARSQSSVPNRFMARRSVAFRGSRTLRMGSPCGSRSVRAAAWWRLRPRSKLD